MDNLAIPTKIFYNRKLGVLPICINTSLGAEIKKMEPESVSVVPTEKTRDNRHKLKYSNTRTIILL